MRTIETTVYKFDELSDKAKEKAREWWRNCERSDFGGHGDEWEPAQTAADLLGITFADNAVSLHGGGTRIEPDIRYSGFYSQGDGASFVGSYEYRKGSTKAIRAEFGNDPKLYAIADGLLAVQRKCGYKLTAEMSQSGRYVHEYSMTVELGGLSWLDYSFYQKRAKELTDEVTDLMRDFARWIYNGLQDEYEYRMSDENVDDAIISNEYEFTAEGKIA